MTLPRHDDASKRYLIKRETLISPPLKIALVTHASDFFSMTARGFQIRGAM